MSDYLKLYDYRQRVFSLYSERDKDELAGEDSAAVWRRFCQDRDMLFAHHPQSALDAEQKRAFTGLRYFPYNPALRFVVAVDTSGEPVQQTITMNAEETMKMTTVGHVRFTIEDTAVTLALYWFDIYGGGLFLPFRDASCPTESYGGGRYLFDTIKGSTFVPVADSEGEERIVLDFNYAYNPSCAYNDAWVCPLAPVENRLAVPVRAGERKYR